MDAHLAGHIVYDKERAEDCQLGVAKGGMKHMHSENPTGLHGLSYAQLQKNNEQAYGFEAVFTRTSGFGCFIGLYWPALRFS